MNDTLNVKKDSLELSLKTVIAIVSLLALVFGWGGAWAGMQNQGIGLEDEIASLKVSLDETNNALKSQAESIQEQIREAHRIQTIELAKHEAADTHMSFQEKVKQFPSREEFLILRQDIRAQDTLMREALVMLARLETQIRSATEKASDHH